MATREVVPDRDGSAGHAASVRTEPSRKTFQFIDLSSNDPKSRKENLTMVRSHITRVRKEFWASMKAKPYPGAFQFIVQSCNDPSSRKENLVKARSHLTKVARLRWQREERKVDEKQGEFAMLLPTVQVVMPEELHHQILPKSVHQDVLDYADQPSSYGEADSDPMLMSQRSLTARALMNHQILPKSVYQDVLDYADQPWWHDKANSNPMLSSQWSPTARALTHRRKPDNVSP